MWRSRYPGIAKSKDQDQSLKTMMIMSATASTSHCSQSAASAEGGLVGGRQPEEHSAVVAGGRDGPTSADSHCLPSFSPWHMCRLGFGRLDKLLLKKIKKIIVNLSLLPSRGRLFHIGYVERRLSMSPFLPFFQDALAFLKTMLDIN